MIDENKTPQNPPNLQPKIAEIKEGRDIPEQITPVQTSTSHAISQTVNSPKESPKLAIGDINPNLSRLDEDLEAEIRKILGPETDKFISKIDEFMAVKLNCDPKELKFIIRERYGLDFSIEMTTLLQNTFRNNQKKVEFTPPTQLKITQLRQKAQIKEAWQYFYDIRKKLEQEKKNTGNPNNPSHKGLTILSSLTQPPQKISKHKISDFTQQILEEIEQGHSMDVQQYAINRFSKTVLEAIIENDLPVEIFTTTKVDMFAQLQNENFSICMPYETTDGAFSKYILFNPINKEYKIVFHTNPGKSYLYQIEATLLSYANETGKKIDPNSVTINENTIDLEQTYSEILESYNVKPDIIVIGNRLQFRKLMESKYNLHPIETIFDPYLEATIYKFTDPKTQKTKTIVSTTITPFLFGDKLSSFIKAVSPTTSSIVFTGTAGGITDKKLGDIVVPEKTSFVNRGEFEHEIPVKNAAIEVLKQMDSQPLNLKFSQTHGTLHSAIRETAPFVDRLKQNRIESIECEIANIAQSISENNPETEFYYYIQISDIPGTQHNNANKTEKFENPYKLENGTVIQRNEITDRITERIIGPPQKLESPVPGPTQKIELEKENTNHNFEFNLSDGTKSSLTVHFEKIDLPASTELRHAQKTFLQLIANLTSKDYLSLDDIKKINSHQVNFRLRYGYSAYINWNQT